MILEHSPGASRPAVLLHRCRPIHRSPVPVCLLCATHPSCAERKMALSFPVALDPIYLNAFHITGPLMITDRSKFFIWNLLGLVENQAKLTEDLHNGLSCEKIEEELKRCCSAI